MENVIEIENLTKSYKMYKSKQARLIEAIFPKINKHTEFKAIDGINLTIKKGEVLGILGKNGAGKSTLLKMITGVVTPTSGKIKVNGRISSLLELGAAFNSDLTGEENIYQHAQVMGMTKEEVEAKKQEIIDFADIGEHLYQPVKTYSSGMFARLAFACAINVNPNILIVDEVLSVGDITFQLKCIKKMKEMMDLGVTILYVSHSPETVMSLCTKAMWIKDGKIHEIGDVKKVSREYSVYMTHGYEVNKEQIEGETLEEKLKRIEQKNKIDISKAVKTGNKKANIEEVKYSLIKDGDTLIEDWEEEQEITMKIKTNSKIQNPLYGYSIMNQSGLAIFHSNSYKSKQENKPLEANSEYEVKLKINLPRLNEGRYSLCVSLDDGVPGMSDIICRLDYLLSFDILNKKEIRQYGVIYLPEMNTQINKLN